MNLKGLKLKCYEISSILSNKIQISRWKIQIFSLKIIFSKKDSLIDFLFPKPSNTLIYIVNSTVYMSQPI